MTYPTPSHARQRAVFTALLGICVVCTAVGAALLGGCNGTDKPVKITNRYPTLPKKQVPVYMQDTILEYTEMTGLEPFAISGYGLVANLNGTGGGRAPSAVRDFIIKEMSRHGFGSVVTGWGSPETLLANRSFAIVRVDGYIPPGARSATDWNTWFDVRVSALPESDTTSFVHGDLYQCDLKVDGANPLEPGNGNVTVKAQAEGPVFINPSFALDTTKNSPEARSSRRNGVVLGGARVLEDRPIILRLRTPERRMARAIEHRLIEHFQNTLDPDLQVKGVAAAQDEGIVYVYLPRAYDGDWEHFTGIVKHLFMRGEAPDYAAIKAQQLADVAVKPNAPLMDLSYCWEGLGKPSLHAIEPLMDSDKLDVQYAAARAAAFIGDPAAVPVLISIARNNDDPFHLNAIQALGQLPASPMVDKMLRPLLESDQALVRVEAYKILSKHKDGSIYTRIVKRGDKEKFVLDIVQGGGTPMVYASRQGIPRLAVFGVQTGVDLPVTFATLDDRLSISSNPDGNSVTIFYRGQELKDPIQMISSPDLGEIAARLGGESTPGQPSLDFSYTDVVAIMQTLCDSQKVSGLCGEQRQLASFMLQELPKVEQTIDNAAPLLRPEGRPQADKPGTASPGILGPGQHPATEGRPSGTDHPAYIGPSVSTANEADVK
jgi:Flagellar P-ring protein